MRFVAAGCLTLVALAACSDTPVSPNAPRALAEHFDSLAGRTPSFVGNSLDQQIFVYLANALAHGAVPGTVTMTMAGKPVLVHMVGVEMVDPNDLSVGNVYAAGWVDRDADTALVLGAGEQGNQVFGPNVALLIDGWVQGGAPSPFAFVQRKSDAPCTNYPIKNEIAGPDATCHLASVTVSFNVLMDSQESPVLLAVGAAIVSPTVTFGLAQLSGGNY